MPSNVPVTREQLVTLADLDVDMVLNEVPDTTLDGTLQVWVFAGDTHHRDIVIDSDGTIIGDVVLEG